MVQFLKYQFDYLPLVKISPCCCYQMPADYWSEWSLLKSVIRVKLGAETALCSKMTCQQYFIVFEIAIDKHSKIYRKRRGEEALTIQWNKR